MKNPITNREALNKLMAFIERDYVPGQLKFEAPRSAHAISDDERAFYLLTNDDPSTNEMLVCAAIVDEGIKMDAALWETCDDEAADASAVFIERVARYVSEVLKGNIVARMHDGSGF